MFQLSDKTMSFCMFLGSFARCNTMMSVHAPMLDTQEFTCMLPLPCWHFAKVSFFLFFFLHSFLSLFLSFLLSFLLCFSLSTVQAGWRSTHWQWHTMNAGIASVSAIVADTHKQKHMTCSKMLDSQERQQIAARVSCKQNDTPWHAMPFGACRRCTQCGQVTWCRLASKPV